MRLRLPTRVPLFAAVAMALVLVVVQQLEHTSINFSLLFGSFVVLSALAFNLAGGFSRVIGAYVFFYALLTVIIGVTWKALLGEPADSNLGAAQADMAIFTLSMLLLLMVVYLVRQFDLRPYALAVRLDHGDLDYTLAGLGCIVVGVGLQFVAPLLPGGPGSLLSGLNQLNSFLTLGIILSTLGVMRDSRGTRAIGFVNGLGLFIATLEGTLAYSKQGMLTPAACWVLSACYMGFRLRKVHLFWLGVVGFLAFAVAPTWSTGRDDVPDGGLPLGASLQLMVFEAQHFHDLREREAEVHEKDKEFGVSGYYNESQGLLDRLTILPPDDALVGYTLRGHYFGYEPLARDFENWVPHVLWPDKPPVITGNAFAHEVGGLAPDDYSTGISYSPAAVAFHMGGWSGVIVVLPLLWFLFFESIDFVVGDIRRSPWPLLSMIAFTHSAAESLVSGIVYATFYGNIAILVAMIFTTRVAPILGALFYGRRADPEPLPAAVHRPGLA